MKDLILARLGARPLGGRQRGAGYRKMPHVTRWVMSQRSGESAASQWTVRLSPPGPADQLWHHQAGPEGHVLPAEDGVGRPAPPVRYFAKK